jgi:hypothetical protein
MKFEMESNVFIYSRGGEFDGFKKISVHDMVDKSHIISLENVRCLGIRTTSTMDIARARCPHY